MFSSPVDKMAVSALPTRVPSVTSRTSKITVATIILVSLLYFAQYIDISQTWGQPASSVVGQHTAQSTKGSSQRFLPLEIAQEICSHRRLDVYSNRDLPRKVYDIFIINTELDSLEIRLAELHKEVDYFVVAESRSTFVGDEKPLYLKENWDRFQQYHDQIIYKEIDLTGTSFEDPWARERFHRNSMYSQVLPFLEGEQRPAWDDVLIVSVSMVFDLDP